MLPQKERLSASDLRLRPLRAVPFLYGTIKLLPHPPQGPSNQGNPAKVKNTAHFKAAVVTAKRTFRSAPLRNSARRRVYAAIRALPKSLLTDLRVVVYPTRAVIDAPFTDVVEHLGVALKKLRSIGEFTKSR